MSFHIGFRLPGRPLAAPLCVAAAIAFGLSGCGGGAASPPAGGAPGLSSPAKPSPAKPSPASSAAASPAASVAGASIAPKPGASAAPASSQTAPGPYKQSGTTSVANGQAAIQALDTLQWQPNTIMAKPGDKVTLPVNNSGNTAHNFISPALGVSTGQDIATGKTTTVNFSAPSQPGTYQFWCNIPGHAEAGMVGEVIVQ
jgi:uncharacterized cupredoxin-like copper-binding protein